MKYTMNHMRTDALCGLFGVTLGTLVMGCLFIALVMLAGCAAEGPQAGEPATQRSSWLAHTSPAPMPADHKAFSQLTVQAAEHWRDLAAEVAVRVYKAYSDRLDLLEHPLYIAAPNNRPFSVAFYNLLRAELISRGLQVSYKKEAYSVLLEYAAQTVPFDPSRFERMWPAEGDGSNHELIVNARMFYHNRFVMHCAAIRYINDKDLALYIDPQIADPLAESTRNIRITGK
jgi:hypothetical protein